MRKDWPDIRCKSFHELREMNPYFVLAAIKGKKQKNVFYLHENRTDHFLLCMSGPTFCCVCESHLRHCFMPQCASSVISPFHEWVIPARLRLRYRLSSFTAASYTTVQPGAAIRPSQWGVSNSSSWYSIAVLCQTAKGLVDGCVRWETHSVFSNLFAHAGLVKCGSKWGPGTDRGSRRDLHGVLSKIRDRNCCSPKQCMSDDFNLVFKSQHFKPTVFQFLAMTS